MTNKHDDTRHHGMGTQLLTLIAVLVTAICIVFAGCNAVALYKTHTRSGQLTAANQTLQTELTHIKGKVANEHVNVAASNSPLSPIDQTNMAMIKGALTKQYTFTSAAQYQTNWRQLHDVITDSNYFRNWYPNDIDNTGHAAVNALGTKSLCEDVNMYKVGANQYLAIVTYISYSNSNDLNHIDVLTPSTQGFLVSCNATAIVQLQPIPNWGLTYAKS